MLVPESSIVITRLVVNPRLVTTYLSQFLSDPGNRLTKTVKITEKVLHIYSFLSSFRYAFSGSEDCLFFDLNTALYQLIDTKHIIVKGTLIARYNHQLWLMVKIALPFSSWDVLKKPMPKILLTREAGRKSIDKIWMYRSARLS